MPRDEIKSCNDQNIPLKDFKLAFCDRCLNADCTRSQMVGDRFSQRTSTWVERLFTQVPRMDTADPRFVKLSAQKFIEVPGRGARTPEVGGGDNDWVDPLQEDSEEKSPTTERMIPQDETDEEVTNPMSQPPEGVTGAPMTEAPPADRHNPLIGSPQAGQLNTPRRQGQMIGSGSASPTIPATSDPWDAPPKPPPEKNVVKPGARIRFSDPKKPD